MKIPAPKAIKYPKRSPLNSGRKTIKMPQKPTKTAIQRRKPIFSPSIKGDSDVVTKGATNVIAVASANGMRLIDQ